MNNNGLSKEDRVFTLTGDSEWVDTTQRMLVRTCWTEMASILCGKHHGLINGKAGRGKSMFLLFFMFEILLCARSGAASALIEGLQPPADVVILYIDRSQNKYLVTPHGIENVVGGCSANITYCFSDNVDISDAKVGSALTLAVTSGDVVVLKEFIKRLEGVGEDQARLYMPSLTVDEMALIFSDLPPEEVQFKFDIVGGNPRKFKIAPPTAPSSKYTKVVSDALNWMFGSSYFSGDSVQLTAKQKLGRWVIDLLVGMLDAAEESKAVLPGSLTDSSLFREFIVRRDYSKEREGFASLFLALVASKLRETFAADVIDNLMHLFGSSGMGNAFEFTSHIVLAGMNEEHICWTSKGTYKKVKLGDKRKVLIRNVADIANLEEGDRGIPTICNFPFIDQVIPPNIGVQFTTSHSHEVSNKCVPDILEALGLTDGAEFMLVFVVPPEVLRDFHFPGNLGHMEMCVTVPEAITEKAFRGLRNRKRKFSDKT